MEIIPITSRYFSFGANAYLLKTDSGCFLIDAGMGKKRSDFEKRLQETGCQPGNLRLIIVTHGHLDHVGNAAYLKDKFGAKVAMHRSDYVMIESGDMFTGVRSVMAGLFRFLVKITGLSVQKFVPDLFLEDNQDLSSHGLDATTVHLPGHSKGSIGVLTTDGDLFCGDLLINMNKPAKNTLIDDQAEYDASVERLSSLQVRTVYPGHGKPFQMPEFLRRER